MNIFFCDAYDFFKMDVFRCRRCGERTMPPIFYSMKIHGKKMLAV